jgi:hypothetical protein
MLAEDMIALFDRIEKDVGPIEVTVFNVGANVSFSILETSGRVYRKVSSPCLVPPILLIISLALLRISVR